MCGIVGFVNTASYADPISIFDIEDLQAAMEAQNHRGPDDQGVCGFSFSRMKTYSGQRSSDLNVNSDYSGLLGFNRLSIKDLSLAGHQPMVGEGGRVILAFNGEIYNDQELRRELSSVFYFNGTSDTEVILNLYLQSGFEGMLSRLNGMFAIVIVDLRIGRVFLARDRYGIKPLYYSFQKGRIAFASELKALIQFRFIDRQIDMKALNARLVFARPSSHVLLSGVEMLEPGHAASTSTVGDTRIWRYYNIDDYDRAEDSFINVKEMMEASENILSDAVSRQMISDVKLGCQLSGGIDSTLVTYYASKIKGSCLNDGVSIVDEAGHAGEEFYIDHVGNKLGLNLHKFKLDSEYFLNNYERMIWSNDAPVYKPYFVCFLKLTECAKEYVTVLLSGEGADELCGGYSRFAAGIYQPFISKLGASASTLRSYASYAEYCVLTDSTLTNFVSLGWSGLDELIREEIECFERYKGSNFTKHIKYEMSRRLPESLMRQDKMSMANSIENRVPLLDNEVVDFVMRLPEQMLLRFVGPSPLGLSENPLDWAAGKYLLKELCARKFGHDFAYRQKQIMVLDERAMLTSAGFIEYFYDSIYPGMRSRGLLDAELVRSWFDNAATIDIKTFSSMWRAISLETWCRLFLDARTNREHY